jgi:hypothetical protein
MGYLATSAGLTALAAAGTAAVGQECFWLLILEQVQSQTEHALLLL